MLQRAPADEIPVDRDRPYLRGPEAPLEFGRLFDTYAHGLHRYLARRVGTETAHDLVSETFLVAADYRHGYDPRRGVVRSWLYGIATTLLRQEQAHPPRALASLSEEDCEVLLLTSWAGLASTEVADALGIPVDSVRSRLRRMRTLDAAVAAPHSAPHTDQRALGNARVRLLAAMLHADVADEPPPRRSLGWWLAAAVLISSVAGRRWRRRSHRS
jgi:DNA-directed RNA polymerase specialized sigma24 family protein